MKIPRKIPGYASLGSVQAWAENQLKARNAPGIASQYASSHACTLEAMRTQERFSLFQGVAHCDMNDSSDDFVR